MKKTLLVTATIFLLFNCVFLSSLSAAPLGNSGSLLFKKVIKGRVTNEKGEPLEHVTVRAKSATQTVLTDAEGFFSINVPDEETALTFSFVGMENKEVSIVGKTTLNVQLTALNMNMDDVVVVGYATQKKANILGAVSTFNPKEVLDLPTANMSTALKNIAPGVGVSQTSGKPGATTNLTIRNAQVWGASGSSNPLYVIDGIAPAVASSGSVDATGKQAFDALDPSQIESITFLKDAAATIYGARGAYGVVIVTTKKGKAGKPRLNYSGSYSTEDASRKTQMLSGYDQANLLNNWVQNYKPGGVISTEVYTPDELNYLKTHNYNWFNEAWRTGNVQRHTLSISGGSDKITFFGGGNYYSENGNLASVYDKKYGFRIGMSAKLIEGMTADVVVSSDNSLSQRPGIKGTSTAEQADQMNATVGGLLHVPGWVPVYNNAGLPVTYTPLGWHPSALFNTGSYVDSKVLNGNVNVSLNYKIPVIKGLSVRAQYGRNTSNSFGKEYYVSYNTANLNTIGVHTNIASGTNKATGTQNVVYTDSVVKMTTIKNGNMLTESTSTSNNWQATEGITYANTFGKHDLSVMLLSEQSQVTGDYYTLTEQTQVIPGYDQFFAFSQDPTNWLSSGTSISGGRVSYMGRLTYSYNSKYLFEAAFRSDASPNFPDNHRWGTFASGSVGWRISEERFFKENVKFFNDLKIRMNVGLTGQDQTSGAFTWVTRFTPTTGYLFGNTLSNALQYGVIPNPDITWESSLKKDLGIDGTFLNRLFNFSLDFWHSHDYNKLESPSATVPNTFGANKFADVNHGTFNQYGIEASIGFNAPIGRKGFVLFGTVNFGLSDNKVINKYYNALSDTGYKNPIGKRADLGISGYKATGIVRTQADVDAWYAKHPGWTINNDSLRVGDLNFQDLDGDGKITSNDITQIATRSSNLFGMGFNIGASYKGFRFSMNLSLGVGGQTVWKKADIATPTKDLSALAMWKNSYTATNTSAPYPAIYAPFATETSSFWLRSATSMTINNMQLSYTLPANLVQRYHLPDMRVYITGINLWDIINPTPFKDSRAGTAADYPILRTWTFGANINL
ncbi:TonB-dependent receptor plug [Russula earlei]|uniref:TonB-dependent receptor plug n=1 Tax=Russula earlei TaxID=71964 RepID=A0ACC0TYW8_9AGAM|nr:TonB-dependent receptor plug [Russula earlei]